MGREGRGGKKRRGERRGRGKGDGREVEGKTLSICSPPEKFSGYTTGYIYN